MLKTIAILALFTLFFAHTNVYAQNGAGELYTPAYSNPYQSPLSSGANTGAASLSGGPMAAPGNGNGNGNNGNGNGNGGNGVPLDTEAWMLMIAGAAFGAWTVAKNRKNATLKLHTPQ
jgi:hypothetical protein